MTRLVVQSDIDVAKRLLDADCTDSGIVAALHLRGLAPAEAARLV